jgi:hypothetical protein
MQCSHIAFSTVPIPSLCLRHIGARQQDGSAHSHAVVLVALCTHTWLLWTRTVTHRSAWQQQSSLLTLNVCLEAVVRNCKLWRAVNCSTMSSSGQRVGQDKESVKRRCAKWSGQHRVNLQIIQCRNHNSTWDFATMSPQPLHEECQMRQDATHKHATCMR